MQFGWIDAFADRPFRGNPAAVCLLEAPRDDAWQQAIAAELNLAETAFLTPGEDGFGLRWFTPVAEVDLCGHATLASAHFLWESGALAATTPARFHTRSGILTAVRDGEWIVLDFPCTPPAPAPAHHDLAPGLGIEPRWVGRTTWDVFVEAGSAEEVRALAPDMDLLRRVPARGIIVTAAGDQEGVDFISRFFGPAVGVPEDPVTGSAHCALAPFWEARLGRPRMTGYQASARGGTVRVERRGDRVLLAGRAVTVVMGKLVG